MTVEELKLEIEKLDESDRATIYYYLIDRDNGFEDVPEEEIQAAWDIECKQRVDEYLAGDVEPVTAEEMFTYARTLAAERTLKRAEKLSA